MSIIAKPFLKWAGGKTQLIEQIKQQLPSAVINKPFTYIEPFVGSGAVLFYLLSRFPNLQQAVINDINADLMNCYLTIKNDAQALITVLQMWESEYHAISENIEAKKTYFYDKRALFNTRQSGQIEQSALFIFLNRTCFNGLYRVNRKNEFNVPIGSYKKPQICFADNLLAASKVLQNVTILCGDYEQTAQYATENTLFYFDPPYKPLSETASFTAYAKEQFDDAAQIRLKHFCERLDQYGYHWLLSNSDVKNSSPDDHFFDDLYKRFNIQRVNARRNINSNATKRGQLTELLISNTL